MIAESLWPESATPLSLASVRSPLSWAASAPESWPVAPDEDVDELQAEATNPPDTRRKAASARRGWEIVMGTFRLSPQVAPRGAGCTLRASRIISSSGKIS